MLSRLRIRYNKLKIRIRYLKLMGKNISKQKKRLGRLHKKLLNIRAVKPFDKTQVLKDALYFCELSIIAKCQLVSFRWNNTAKGKLMHI